MIIFFSCINSIRGYKLLYIFRIYENSFSFLVGARYFCVKKRYLLGASEVEAPMNFRYQFKTEANTWKNSSVNARWEAFEPVSISEWSDSDILNTYFLRKGNSGAGNLLCFVRSIFLYFTCNLNKYRWYLQVIWSSS